MKPRMMTITGPSCSGKTHLLGSLLEMENNNFYRLVSDTTRPPRKGKLEPEYRFLTEQEFLAVEDHQQRVNFGGHFYGTRSSEMTEAFEKGLCPIRVVDPKGMVDFKEICNSMGAESVSIYVDESIDVLAYRWMERYREDPNPSYPARLVHTFKDEVNWKDQLDYDFYYDLRYQQEVELNYALTRIATGKISLPVVRSISPRVA